MPTSKIYDLAVKVGEYQSGGETKSRYLNIGSVMQKEDGGKFILLERTVNLAGIPNPDNRSNVIVSMFEPRDSSGTQQQRAASTSRAPANRARPPADEMDDDIPF